MSQLRRITALLSSVMLLQLTLLGSGTICGMHAAGSPMAAVDMSAMTGAHATPHAPARGCDSAAGLHECGSPSSPTSCAGMQSCATVAAPQASLLVLGTPRLTTAAMSEPASALAGPTLAPELPPPRA